MCRKVHAHELALAFETLGIGPLDGGFDGWPGRFFEPESVVFVAEVEERAHHVIVARLEA